MLNFCSSDTKLLSRLRLTEHCVFTILRVPHATDIATSTSTRHFWQSICFVCFVHYAVFNYTKDQYNTLILQQCFDGCFS